ncbi:MAG TPA: hypothetical protein VG371_04480 [Solirubrobacteraceae bacterium]|jgi:anti-sigma factor RsiW|nr:hypothetical protein [Solirubrobacteraceae bacterium]
MTHEPTPPEAELAKLADGSLPADREAELRAQVRQSPNLATALAEQERAVSLVRALDEPAPDALRERVEALTGGASPTRRARAFRGRRYRMRRTLVLPGATALAVAIAALVILIGGSGSPPTVPQAAHLALSAATLPPPGVEPGKPGLLRMSAAGIPFSNWRGWRPVGARTDVVNGRRITTVFYKAPNGARVGYAIASGRPLEGNGREGGYDVTYTLGHQGSVQFVTWVRDGHTCVIAGHRADPSTLLALARESGGSSSS